MTFNANVKKRSQEEMVTGLISGQRTWKFESRFFLRLKGFLNGWKLILIKEGMDFIKKLKVSNCRTTLL